MKFTLDEYRMLLIGLREWKSQLNWQHWRYKDIEKLESKLHNMKPEIVED